MALGRSGFASLAFLGGALVFGVVLGLVLAFGASDTDPWEAQWADLGVPEAEFVFLGDLTEEERESIRAELRSAQVVFWEHFRAVRSDFSVYVSTDLEVLNARLSEDYGEDATVWFTCGGIALPAAIAIVLEDCGTETRARGGPMAHEYFHILQGRATRPATMDTTNPSGGFPPVLLHQLVEGSAVYASAIHHESRGRSSLESGLQGARLSWAALGADPSYGELGSRDDWLSFIYSGGLLAAEWLVARAGPEAILKFFRTGAHRAAFQGAFGLSVDAFQAAIARHLQEVAPPFEWRIAGSVLDANDMPAEGINLGPVVRIAGEPWLAGSHTTVQGGAFEFMGPGSEYALGVWLQCPDTDGTWGRTVLVGEFGEGGFVADDDGIYERGDEGAAPFEGEDRDRSELLIRLPTTLAELTEQHCES